jgi:protein kinase C substrate 80K-H
MRNVAVLSTPALCIEEKLKELQNKLDAMSSKQPGHDEL